MSAPSAPRPFSPWPYAIIGWFALFIAGIVTFVVWSFGHRMELVRPDYYEQEMRFQQQMDRQRRTAALGAQAVIGFDAARATVQVRLPADHAPVARGTIEFYRPSDARLDHAVALAPDAAGRQTVEVARLRAGLWRVRMHWSAHGQEYHLERTIVIGG